MTPDEISELYQSHVEQDIAWRGYKWLFYAPYPRWGIRHLEERFGEFNHRRKMFDPNLRWYYGVTTKGFNQPILWAGFRTDIDAVEFKLAFGDEKLFRWEGSL